LELKQLFTSTAFIVNIFMCVSGWRMANRCFHGSVSKACACVNMVQN